MAYCTLEKTFYADASSDRYANVEELYTSRFNSESTYRTGIELESGEMFLSVPHELLYNTEQVLRKERRVSALWRDLPIVALGAYVRSLIMDEVVYSNEIEGVHSIRRQIEEALAANDKSAHAPFVEFAQLYLNLSNNPPMPQSLQDIRRIYDSVVADAISPEDLPGDGLFRSGPVEILNQHGKTVHKGVYPPQKIEEMMSAWLGLSQREDIPELYAAALCHFLFGYIHPFFDGNGRTGRYLLALQLSRPLSQPTVLSLSRVIAENKATYYRAFDAVERPLNRSDATSFVIAILDLISDAQDGLIANLEEKKRALDGLFECVHNLEGEFSKRQLEALCYAAQIHLYSIFGEIRLDGLREYLDVSLPTARNCAKELERLELMSRVSQRPPIYKLTDVGAELLGIG